MFIDWLTVHLGIWVMLYSSVWHTILHKSIKSNRATQEYKTLPTRARYVNESHQVGPYLIEYNSSTYYYVFKCPLCQILWTDSSSEFFTYNYIHGEFVRVTSLLTLKEFCIGHEMQINVGVPVRGCLLDLFCYAVGSYITSLYKQLIHLLFQHNLNLILIQNFYHHVEDLKKVGYS